MPLGVRLCRLGPGFHNNCMSAKHTLHCSFLTIKFPEQKCKCAQADVEGPGCVEVTNKLAAWGLTGQMNRFSEQVQ